MHTACDDEAVVQNYRTAQRVLEAKHDDSVPCNCTVPPSTDDQLVIKSRSLPKVNSFVTKQTLPDGDVIRVLNVFYPCTSEAEARSLATKKGGGARPDKHRPHTKPGDRAYFWHYHPGNHILSYENGIHVNYHFMWEDQDHQRQFG